uniref:DUF3338 domain-containing protein n=1 Tax=Heterorhabditis bacteriophora TaxID=37862 RepID=A0A1I7WMZ8_HETBA
MPHLTVTVSVPVMSQNYLLYIPIISHSLRVQPLVGGLDHQELKKSDEDRQRDIELYKQLKTKKAQLEEKLKMRLCELRSVCVREGELSGEMPKEMKRALLPGEELPKLKKRVGTAFSIPEEVLKADKVDKISQLETDVELHRKIVAAAERLAKDKSMNKSVRKKRQKVNFNLLSFYINFLFYLKLLQDLAAAALKLRGLELGLNQMRLSASKPDVSSLGSHETGNPWPTFPTNGAHLTRAVAKSCPTTPRGSVPDLCNQMEGEKSDYEDDEQIPRRAPSASSRRSFHQRFSEASTSSSSSMGLPPRANSRRSLATRSITSDELDNPLTIEQPPIYENVGYRSTSYRSSYRQAHYPTIQDDQHMRKRAQSVHVISQFEELGSKDNGSYNIPMEDATWKFKQDEKQSQYLNNDDDITPTIEHPAPLRKLPKSISCQEGFSTASLDRRAIRNR